MDKRHRMTARTAPLVGLCAMTGLLLGSVAAHATTPVTVNLGQSAEDFVEPLVVGGSPTATALGLNFTYVTYACSGVSVATCTPGAVGLTNGAVGQGPTTAVVTFDDSVPTTTTTTTTTLPTGPCGGIP